VNQPRQPTDAKQFEPPLRRATSRSLDSGWSMFDNTKGLVPAGTPGWTEKHIRSVVVLAAETFPECGFAVATFAPDSDSPTKTFCSNGTELALETLFARSKWRSEWLAGGSSGGIVAIPVGVRGVAPFSHEMQESILGARHLLIFAMPGLLNVMLAVWRSADYGPFREPEMGPLREKAQSIASVIRLGTEVGATQTTELAANLDRLRLGFIVVDQLLRMTYINVIAQEMLQQGVYAHAVDNTLKLDDPVSEARLRQVINHIAPLSKQVSEATGIIAIRAGNSDGLARCIVNLQRDADDSLLGPALFALTISAQGNTATMQPAHLRRLGFTPAESELAADLLKGLTVTQHARERGIAVATARAHLKRAMMRVGVHRQADLIRHIVGLS
jgi:DNA-binding NarL/FixJ family response regulator